MLISVVVPIYNTEKYLRQCVDSILSQTYKNIEIILVDDGSKDSSPLICDEYEKADSRITVIHKKNGGLSSARNFGIKQSRGCYIIFLDSDDCWNNDRFLETIDNNCNDELVIWKYIKSKQVTDYFKITDEIIVYKYNLRDDYKKLFRKNILFASACMVAVPKRFFDNNKLFFVEGETSEDIEWFAKLLCLADCIVYFDSPIYFYRIRKNSISNTMNPKMITDFKKHIQTIATLVDSNQNDIMEIYLAEQVANYVIVLSRCSEIMDDWRIDQKLLRNILSNSLRLRSRLIFYFTSSFGEKACTKMLKRIDYLKRRK